MTGAGVSMPEPHNLVNGWPEHDKQLPHPALVRDGLDPWECGECGQRHPEDADKAGVPESEPHNLVNDDGRCPHGVMWGDRTDVLGRDGVRLCWQCESAAHMVVTDCCGRLLPESRTLRNDVHFSDLCPSCLSGDGSEHESHITCKGDDCPGRDWTYDPTTHKVVKP